MTYRMIKCVIPVLSVKRCLSVCCRVVYSVLFDSWEIIGPYRAWWLLNGLLLLLQALHIIWFYLIARIAIKAIFKGKVSPASPSCVIRNILTNACRSLIRVYTKHTVCEMWKYNLVKHKF